ncbi:amidohydrolase family protein [Euzebya tangerina]|uniref:amidohydrolase family protein n=1 Tax=Euzebya tangerina TaxID=591198 RepID=UPI000E3131A9|nr:amidohydrolase family protein [Euzebya tangerina]
MIIDAHTHVWPDHVAARALGGSGLDDLPRFGDGTAGSLVEVMDAAGVDRSVVLAVANTAERVESANTFTGSLDPDRFIGFGSAHARSDPDELVASLRRHGLRGVKVHPLFQDYALDDPGLLRVLDALRGEFAAIVHVGSAGDPEKAARCTPTMIVEVARQLPGLDLIACHFGGYRVIEEAAEVVVGTPGLYLDTSWPPSLATLDPDLVAGLVRRHGPDRVIFASDWPMADPAAEIEAVRALGLEEDETDAILGGNLARILSLE